MKTKGIRAAVEIKVKIRLKGKEVTISEVEARNLLGELKRVFQENYYNTPFYPHRGDNLNTQPLTWDSGTTITSTNGDYSADRLANR